MLQETAERLRGMSPHDLLLLHIWPDFLKGRNVEKRKSKDGAEI